MTRRNELSGGTPVVRQFEEKWRQQIGVRYCITTCNGSAALYSAFFGLGIGPGDEVICPTFNWISSIAPALLLGARPVFCDVDPETLLIDPQDVRKRITDKTRAILVVHLWGLVADMDPIMEIAKEFDLRVIEDCSHAHGASYKGKPAGSMGHAAAWSFQGSKPVSGGEAGAFVTNDQDCFERACLVGQVNRIKGVDLVSERYADLQPYGIGYKFRAHPLGVGIAGVQFAKLAQLNEGRQAFAAAVEEGLSDIPYLKPVKRYPGAERAGFYGFPIHFVREKALGMSRDEYVDKVRAAGMDVGPSPYPLLHLLPLFSKGFDLFTRNRGPLCGDYKGYREGDFPQAERMHEGLVFLPVVSKPRKGAVETLLDALRA
jgi:dTDP-4-amino-4,6-dideoxygalactose transaminase